MRSELFRIPYELYGVPIFGVGVLLAVWLIVAVVGFAQNVRRHGWSGESWSQIALTALIAATIVYLPAIFPGGLPVRGYGVMLLVAGASGVALACHRASQLGIDREVIFSMAFWLLICGIIGARLFYVVEYWEADFRSDSWRQTLVNVISFPQGGLVIYGAMVGGVVAFFAFVRRHRLPALAMADLIAPSVMVGLALGRIGCLLNGCCYGGACERPWAVRFPPQSPPYMNQVARGDMYGFRIAADAGGTPLVVDVDAGSAADEAGLSAGDRVTAINGQKVDGVGSAAQLLMNAYHDRQPLELATQSGGRLTIDAVPIAARSRPVHPTQVYSAVSAGLIAWLLWAYFPFRRRDGEVFALMITIYPVIRFLLEIIRVDEPAVFGTGLSISQNISIAILATVVGFWLYLRSRPPGLALPIS